MEVTFENHSCDLVEVKVEVIQVLSLEEEIKRKNYMRIIVVVRGRNLLVITLDTRRKWPQPLRGSIILYLP